VTIDPKFLDELERYARARARSVASRGQGERRSTERGEGLTFADYRRYSPGDDTRRIDWNLFARTDEFYVKEFEAERSTTVHVLLDTSGSMGFTGDPARESKFEFGAKLGLGFAYLVARAHDEFRFATVADRFERLDRGRSNRGEVLSLLDRLNATTPAGGTDMRGALEGYAGTIGSRSLVLVVSDFLEPPAAVGTALSALSRNQLVCARLLDPAERSLPVSGDVVADDPESDRTVRTHLGGRRREAYRRRLDEHVEAVAERARTVGARHELFTTDEDLFDAFGRLWTG
jgi:uncharacterized protein (DUF58 family)